MLDRKGTMTDRGRVEALLRREKPDRVPIWPFAPQGFAMINAGYTIAEAYNNPEKSLHAQRWCSEQYGWVCSPRIGYAAYGCWEFGGEIKWPSGEFSQAPMITKYAAETEQDVWNLKTPDVKTAGIIPLLMEFCRISSQERFDNELFNVVVFGAGMPFTIAGNICGPDKLCKWILKKPDVAHRLLRLATDHIIEAGRYWKDTFGIDGILPRGGEATASNQLISAKQFEQFALPYIKEVNEAFLNMGYKHLYVLVSGDHNDDLPHWAQVPMGDPGFVCFGHEVDLEIAAKCFPNDIILGNLEPALIQTGTPQQVYELTKICIEKGKKCPGGFIFSPGDDLPPMAPPVNVWMMTKAVTDFGWYD
jgi:uroporphyrinogen decarboxylase